VFVPGIYYLVNISRSGLMAVWAWALLYVALLSAVYALRFHAGRWRAINILKD
jgi:hypothetical protein